MPPVINGLKPVFVDFKIMPESDNPGTVTPNNLLSAKFQAAWKAPQNQMLPVINRISDRSMPKRKMPKKAETLNSELKPFIRVKKIVFARQAVNNFCRFNQ